MWSHVKNLTVLLKILEHYVAVDLIIDVTGAFFIKLLSWLHIFWGQTWEISETTNVYCGQSLCEHYTQMIAECLRAFPALNWISAYVYPLKYKQGTREPWTSGACQHNIWKFGQFGFRVPQQGKILSTWIVSKPPNIKKIGQNRLENNVLFPDSETLQSAQSTNQSA